MWRKAGELVLAVLILLTSGSLQAVEFDSTLARRIAEHADTLMRGRSNYGTYKMIVVRPDWSRSITMKSWERGKELSFIEVTGPPKEAGTAFLKRRGQMWTWLPDIERTVKIPPSMMMGTWMGSDFTNDDLLHESSLSDDYTHTVIALDTVDTFPTYVVELKSRPEAPVVWDRILIWVRVNDFMPLQQDYYDEKGRKIRTMYFKEIGRLGGRNIPKRLILEPHLKQGQRTEFEIIDVEFDVRIPDRIFTRQHLERSR